MTDHSITFSDVVGEARDRMIGRFGQYVDVISYNPGNSPVPHLVILFSLPKEYDDSVAKEVRSICMFLNDPQANLGKGNFDFEPAYENFIANYNVPFKVGDRQRKLIIKEPKYDPRMPAGKGIFLPVLDHFGAKTGISTDEFYEMHTERKQMYDTIDRGLKVKKDGVYKPKHQIHPSQMTFVGGEVSRKRPSHQVSLSKMETRKYRIEPRQEGQRTVIPDLWYYLEHHSHPLLGEVKPWTINDDTTIRERVAQFCNYDAACRYNKDKGIMPMALVIPEIASAKELAGLEHVNNLTQRQVYVFTISGKRYFARRLLYRKAKAERILESVKNMSLPQIEKYLAEDIETYEKELNHLERIIGNFDI